MVDNTKDKDKQSDSSKDDEEDEDSEDYSITTTTSSKARVPEINLFGIKVKLDTLTLAVGAVATAALGSAGYLLYDQFTKNKAIEDERKAFQERERQKAQAVYNQYVQQPPVQQPVKRVMNVPIPEPEDNLVDMDNYYNPNEMGRDEEPPSIDKILNRGPHSYQSIPSPKQAPKYAPTVANAGDDNVQPAVVDMERYSEEPEMDVIPTVASPVVKRKRQQQEEVQENNNNDPTEAELYAQMNANNNNYY